MVFPHSRKRTGTRTNRVLSPAGVTVRRLCGLLVVLSGHCLACVCFPPCSYAGDFLGPDLPSLATPAQRLMMEQIDELARSGQASEAVANLEKLFDQADNRVVIVGEVQRSGTLSVRRAIPLRSWAKLRLLDVLAGNEEANRAYQARLGAAARAAFEELRSSKDLLQLSASSERYFATEYGPRLCTLQADLFLEQGWALAAVQAAQNACLDLRLPLDVKGQERGKDLAAAALGDTIAWWDVWRLAGPADRQYLELLRELVDRPSLHGDDRPRRMSEALQRVLMAAALSPSEVDRELIIRWAKSVVSVLDEETSSRLSEVIERTKDWQAAASLPVYATTFGGSPQRNHGKQNPFTPRDWPAWSHALPRYTATTDSNPASQPRVGETIQGTLPYHPVFYDGLVFVNTLSELRAYETSSGEPWPNGDATPLYDTDIAHAALIPLNYPLVGSARGTLTIDEDQLFARIGNPVSGWTNVKPRSEIGSVSHLIGLDLRREGAMLPGFPIKLLPPEFEQAEFEGSPVVVGDLIIAAVTHRDDVGLIRRVAAFDRRDGSLRWKSKPLASGTVEGMDRANLISHQLLSYAGGRIFYDTGLGAIACLDVLTGQTVWISEYSRVEKRQQKYPTTDRFRYRDMSPCVVWRGLVYCLPQDAAEMFALDACTGDLIWSTDAGQTEDLVSLLGVTDEHVVVGGDHLAWFDRQGGKLVARFPDSSTPGPVNALPNPRGLGRGAIAGNRIYWPVYGRLLIFEAQPKNVGQALPSNVVELESFGSEGGNLYFYDDRLFLLTPSRIVAFGPDQ